MSRSRRQPEAAQTVEPGTRARTGRALSDPLGYDMSNFGMAVDKMIDDVRTGRTAESVGKELAAIRRRYGSVKKPASGAKMSRPRRRSNARDATAVDAQVGIRVRTRRLELGMSQTALAEACKITFQQIQKYENGANRVSASRLWQFAAVMEVPVDYFFAGLGTHKISAAVVKNLEANRRGAVPRNGEIEMETMRLARVIATIADPAMKKRLKAMITALAD
jgi:transcriptional regulator with XRE-family HTH domain